MVNVIVAGVPKNFNISQFIEFLECNIFQEKIKVQVNYVRWYKRDLKKLSLNMRSNDARKAIRYLNGYEFVSRRANYTLCCWKENSSDRSESEDEPPSKIKRTFSPFDESNELRVIDVQDHTDYLTFKIVSSQHRIELIRKQRILLEEESQLLLQKKRLEMIQNLGPNDFHKLSELEEMVETNQSITEIRVKGKLRRPPDFQGPWLIIYEKMKSVINAYVNDQDRPIFLDLLRSRVKNRLALLLKDKGNLRAKEILALYRSIHSVECDISLVQEVLVKIDQSIYPIHMTTKFNNGEKSDQDNTTDEKEDHAEYDYEDVDNTVLKKSQNEEMAFYEDVNPDYDNNTKKETLEKEEVYFERKQFTKKETNYEDIQIFECDSNITFSQNCEKEVYKPKEINKIECKDEANECRTESNNRSEETHLNTGREMCRDESDFTSLNTNKQIEPALNEVLDLDNDLDDWDEDKNEQEIKAEN